MSILRVTAPFLVFAVLMIMPTPEGLTPQGQAALAVMCLAVILWATEALPIAVTALVGIVLLILVGGVSDIGAALYGFSQPVAYFLIGILTLGMAVHRSGLAERVSIFLMRGAGAVLSFSMSRCFSHSPSSRSRFRPRARGEPFWCTSTNR